VSLADAVADEVRRRMSARGLSQNALARAAGMPPTLLHRAMSGERALSIDELDALARALEVTPEHLLRLARTRAPLSDECSEPNSEPRQV
jgi:transcriptional regulator with XRE-family HTH domain